MSFPLAGDLACGHQLWPPAPKRCSANAEAAGTNLYLLPPTAVIKETARVAGDLGLACITSESNGVGTCVRELVVVSTRKS
jgi:hypothetical protein